MKRIGFLFCLMCIVGVTGCVEDLVGDSGDHHVTIKVDPEDHTKLLVEPEHIEVKYGSQAIIAFEAIGTDAVLRFENAVLFGELEYEIAAGEILALKVQKDAPKEPYDYHVDDGEQASSGKQQALSPCIIVGGGPG